MNKLLTTGFIGRKELNITYTNIAGTLNIFGTKFKRVHIILPGSYFAILPPTTTLIRCRHSKLNRAGSRKSLIKLPSDLETLKADDLDGPRPAGDGQRVLADRTIRSSHLRATGGGNEKVWRGSG